MTTVEYRRDGNIAIYIWLTFSHVAETYRAIWENVATGYCVVQLWTLGSTVDFASAFSNVVDVIHSIFTLKLPEFQGTPCSKETWSLRDYNWTRTNNQLVHKRTLNHLAKLAKWLNCVVSTYLFSSCHVRVPVDSLWNTYVTW